MTLHQTTSSTRPAGAARALDRPVEELAFTIGNTELGIVLIAGSIVGVCSILMGSDEEELCVRALGARMRRVGAGAKAAMLDSCDRCS